MVRLAVIDYESDSTVLVIYICYGNTIVVPYIQSNSITLLRFSYTELKICSFICWYKCIYSLVVSNFLGFSTLLTDKIKFPWFILILIGLISIKHIILPVEYYFVLQRTGTVHPYRTLEFTPVFSEVCVVFFSIM